MYNSIYIFYSITLYMHDLTLNGSDMLFFKFIATIELYKPLKSV